MTEPSGLFDVAVPEDDLEAPAFEPMPTASYKTTLQDGTEFVENDKGWRGLRVPFAGFTSLKDGKDYANRQLHAQFTVAHKTSDIAVRIGRQGVIGTARAFGLTEETTGENGKKAFKLAATSDDELVEQFATMAGTEVGVYIVAKKGTRQKNDGTFFIDNEIKRVFAL